MKNKKERLGYNGVEEVISHPFFKSIDFGMMYRQEYEPPFKPVERTIGDKNKMGINNPLSESVIPPSK